MNCVSGLRDDRVESTVMVGGVLDGAGGAIRFNQAVVTFNFVAHTFLGLFLDVMCVGIFNSILEFILWWSLNHKRVIVRVPCCRIRYIIFCLPVCYTKS